MSQGLRYTLLRETWSGIVATAASGRQGYGHFVDATGVTFAKTGHRWKCLNRNSFVVGSGITEMPTQRKQQPWTKTVEQGYPPKNPGLLANSHSMAVVMTLGNSKVIKIIAGFLCSILFLNALVSNVVDYTATQHMIRGGGGHSRRADDYLYEAIQNETLGFEHVYAIGLKERTDKRDFLALAASIVGFQVDWLDGVRPDEVHPKSLPQGLNMTIIKPTAAACWRAHMNALRTVVEKRHATALIMEDDADWDVSLKQQLREFARGLRTLSPTTTATKQAPYGTDWDLLWVGGCSTAAGANETQFYAIPNDPTVPGMNRRSFWVDRRGPVDQWKQRFPQLREESTRYVYRADTGCCLYGYAVTYNGARKILASLSVDHLEVPVDNALGDMCGGRNRPQIQCYAPHPNLIATHRRAGSSYKDSDIESYGQDNWHPDEAWDLVYSTKLNLHRLLAGSEKVMSQWPDDHNPWSPAELKMKEFQYPQGFHVAYSKDV
ncbi:hypothetical protein KXX33_000313 [Aspergillus fumigatus]|nr:hypothetical protein KXX30_008908 [Aspergillus fumigatus]KAH1306148.1 hypothetical protein KXX66_002326 [Aspergillus fumigatus]KAH1351042.1 hypothetical protein KXX33_000313 [Aspergillus fumigatus]KAH1377373.1 hypothetical protein KXX50_009292 [Aspergillus fumigatus]KAH1479938.1 hypothetical protein KXX26_009168 [Aspergillus fumigatus]